MDYKPTTKDRFEVAGFISGYRAGRDGTVRFAIGRGGYKTRFCVQATDPRIFGVGNGCRVLVAYQKNGEAHPYVERIIYNPSPEQILQAAAWTDNQGGLPE
jgi:hypothetical protein